MQLDHVTIRTRDIAATRDFFMRVFDLKPGDRPQLIQRIPGCWLYAGDAPIVHVIGAHGRGFDRAPEAIDHVGFRMTGYADFRARLDRFAIRYQTMDLTDRGERRLFFRTPGGPLLEAVFAEQVTESEGLSPVPSR
ncbi:hypothetical protein BN1110_06241 [bacterium YEK0313]|nr:hypothetical protein BN1110_06241 [bacterium YEK0313]